MKLSSSLIFMAIQANISFLSSNSSQFLLNSHFKCHFKPNFFNNPLERKKIGFLSIVKSKGDEEYLIDAPVQVGDGFSFSGGKYSDPDGTSPSDEWFRKGKMVKAHPVGGTGGKAKDPIFGLTMGCSSQASADLFRWFCVEDGKTTNHSVVLLHGLPSQAYSYRNILPILAKNYHAIAFDWLGFGFSDKPQPKYGFDYTLDEYVSSLESLIDKLNLGKVSLVVQGYFAPVAVKYAIKHQENVKDLILINPPLVDKHANLPSTLAVLSNFLLGEVFSQDPLRASDKLMTSSGPYKIKEEIAMVYRRPYLTSGASGFALNALSKTMKKELKDNIGAMRKILSSDDWKVRTTVCWGQRDRWLTFDGVESYCKELGCKLMELPSAGHHVQEDSGEELGKIISRVISQNV